MKTYQCSFPEYDRPVFMTVHLSSSDAAEEAAEFLFEKLARETTNFVVSVLDVEEGIEKLFSVDVVPVPSFEAREIK